MDSLQDIILKIEKLKEKAKFQDAISLLEKSIVQYQSDYRLYEELSDIYIYTGDFGKAMNAINFALELNNNSATGNYLKGFLLLGEDQVDSAIGYLEKSNKLMGNNAEVLRNIGWAHTLLGEHQKGISILRRALNLSPNDTLIVEDLAMALIGYGSIQSGNHLLEQIGKQPVTH